MIFKRLLIGFIFLFSGHYYYSQCSNLSVVAGTNANLVTETLYEENFIGQNDKGAIGSTIDILDCNWTVDVTSAILTDNDDYFKVKDEKFEAKDVDGNCIWSSPSINISNYHNVSLNILATESGSLENSDFMYSEYSVDGGVWNYFSSFGQLSNDFNSRTVSQSGLRGNSVKIRITVKNNESNEYIRFDDVKVTGQTYKTNLCFGSSLSLGGANTTTWSGSGTPAISYTWTPSTNLDDPTIANPNANPTSDVIYKVVSSLYDNGNLCKDSSLFYVNVTPEVTIQSTDPVCIDDTLILSEMGGEASLWTWTSNGSADILNFEDTTTQVVGMTNGEIFTVSVEDDYGCTNSASVTIIVNPKPTNVTLAPFGNYCSSASPVNLTGGLPSGGYYSGNGVTSNIYDPSSAGYGSTLENINLMYIWADANGCKDTVTAPIDIQLAPEVDLTSSFLSLNPTDDDYLTISAQTGGWSKCGSVDPTFNLQLELTNASVANNSANVTYDLDFGDGNTIPNILPGVVYNNTYGGQGAYDIIVTATDNITGCVRTYEKEFFYGTNPAVSLGTPGNTTGRCAPASYGFPVEFFSIDLATGDTTINSPGTSYLKFTNDGKEDSIFVHPSPKENLVKSVIDHSFDDASCGYSFAGLDNIFSIAITATNGCGSSSASVFPITQSSPPEAKIADTDSIFCIDIPVTFIDSSRAGKFIQSQWNGIGYDYSCDTIGATAWEITPNTGFTVTSGSLGTLPLDYYDSTTYGTQEITLTFHERNTYSIALYKSAQCGGGIAIDSTAYEFKIDSLPHAKFILDKDIDCGPFSVSNNNISLSKNDYYSTFDWSFSTLIEGCRGSAAPNIEKELSDSSIVTLYNQDFGGMENKGYDGVISDMSLVDWTMDVAATSMVDGNDWFKIRNQKLEAQDINGTGIWYSPLIDISSINMISLELNAEESVINYLQNTNLEGYWELDENSGLVAGDSSGNSRNAAISGASWIAGKVGTALSFDGNDEVIATGYKGVSGSTARTIAAWIKTSTTGAITYWGRDLSGQKSSFRVQDNNGIAGSIRLEINDGRICGSTDLRDNQWHHVCAVLPDGSSDISQVLLYVDGQLEAYSHIYPNPINTASFDDFKIGNDGLNRYFNGIIDEVRLYSRALSIEEINDLPGFSNAIANPNELKTEYRIDGGPWTLSETNGSLTGDFNTATVTQDSLTGSSLELKITMNTVDQIFTADNIKVSGYGNYDSLNATYNFTKAGLYTIDLTATNVCGSDLYQDTVTVQGAPVVTIDAIIDTCETKNLFPTATIDTCFGIMSGYSWTFPGSAANETSILEIPNMIYYDSVGVFKTYIDVTNNCGSDQDSLVFEIHDDPVIDLKPIDSVCLGLNTVLSPSITEGSPNYIYSWSSNAIVSNPSSASPAITTFSDEKVYLEVTDNNNCMAYDTILVDVLDLPTVDAGLFQSVCPEDTAFLIGSISGAIPPYTFTWDLAKLSDVTVINPYYIMDGTETFTFTATDSFGCINSNSVTINERISPTVIAGQDTALCDQPIAVAFSGLPLGGTWEGNKIDNVGLFLPNGIAQDTAIYQYTDGFGCYNEDTLLIDVQATVLANAGTDFEKCISESQVNLKGSPSGGYWDHINVISNTTNSIYEEFFTGLNGKGATNAGVDVTDCNWSIDLNGTNLTSTFNYIKVNSNRLEARGLYGSVYWLSPVLDIQEYDNVSISFNATESGFHEFNDVIESEYRLDGGLWTYFSVNGQLNDDFPPKVVSQSSLNGNTLEFRIKFANNSTSEYLRVDDIKVEGVLSGSFSVSVADTFALPYIYGTGNCINNDTMNLVINPLPIVSAGSDTSVCYSDTLLLNNGTPLGGTWTGIGIPASSSKFIGSQAGVGLHTIYYSYEDSNSCKNLDSMVVNVWALPLVDAGNDTILCNQPGVVDFDGNFIPGYWTGNSIDSSGGFEPNGIGLYDLYYHHTDLNGCYNNDTIQINVIDPTNAIVGNDFQACIDSGAIQLNGLPIGGVWTGTSAITGISVSGGGIYTTSMIDTLDLVYSYGVGNCLTRDTVNLIVNPLPNLDVGLDFEVCIDDTIQVLNPNLSGGTWTGIGITDPLKDFNPSVAGPGIHELVYYYKDSNTCDITDTLNITVYALPIVSVPNDTSICDLPATVTFNATPLGGNWLDSNMNNAGVYNPDGVGVFEIYYEFTDINTCYNIDTFELTVVAPQISDAGLDIQACIDTGLIQLIGLPLGAGTWNGSGVTFNGDYDVLTVDTVDLAYNIASGNCFTSDTMNILIHPLPEITLDNSFEICISFGDTAIQFSPFGGTWTGLGIDPSSGLFSPIVAGMGTHTLLYAYQHPVTGCWNYDSLDVTVNPLPAVNYTHDSIFCLDVGKQILNTTTEVQNHYWSISDGSLSNQSSPIFTIDTVGFFDVNYIAETNKGCLDSASSSIEVLAPPVANFTAPDSGCGPLIVDFTNNSVGKYISFLWDLGLENYLGIDSVSTDTIPSSQSYPAGIYFDTTYYTSLTVSNYCGVSVQNLDIISMPVPVSRFGPYSNVGGCASGTITLANNSHGLPDTYYWDFGDGTFGVNNDTLFDHYYTPGPSTLFYTITMAVTNECGTDTTTETVTILPSSLVAFFSVDTTVGCAPFSVDFEQFSIGGSTSSWDFNDGNFSNSYSPTHTFTDSGTYEVSLAVSNVCNFDTAYKTIRVNTSPNVSFSVTDDTLCAGSTFQFNNSSDFAISNNWDFGDGATSFLTNPNHIYADSGSYRAILTGTSLTNNCPAFDSVDLVVLPYPEITASSDTSNGCIPLPVNFSSTVNSVGYYLWDFGDGNSSNLANPYHTYSTDGYYSVNVRFEDLTGCVDSFDFNVNPYPVPQTNFVSQQLDTCVLPINYNFQNLSLGGSSYSWDFGDGNVSSLASPAHTYTAEGNYDINLITSNTYGCEDSTSTTIIVNPVPSSQFDAIQLDTCSIPANYNFANNSTGAIAYIWDLGDGVASNLPNLSHSYNNDGTYEISLISMNAVGCFDTAFVTVNVIPVPDLSFNFTPLDTCTVPASFSFQNTSLGATNYLWDFGDGLYSPLTSPFHTFNAAGDYNVNLTSTNIFGCSDTSTQLISVNPIPVAQFNPIQLDTCTLPASYSLVNTSSGSIVYSWSLGDGSNTNSANLNYAYTNSGTYDITLSAMNQYGCFDSSTVTVIVPPIPTADFSSNKLDLCVLPSNYSFTNNSVGASNYIWTFDTLANSIQTNPIFTFNNDGIYEVSLLATNSSGCSDSIIEFINVNPIPVADFNLDTTIGCEPFTAIFTNTSQNATFYNWDFNDGNYGAFFNGFHQFQNFGNYTVNLVVEDINGCRDSTFKNLNVYPSPVSSYTYVATDPCYLPIAVDYTNTSTGANSFQWNFGGLQSTTVTNPSFIYDSIGIYNIQLISGNSYNCYDTLNNIFDVFFNQVPNAQFNFDNTICFRDTSFFNSASLYADSLVWDLGNGIIASGDTVSFVYDAAGQYNITLYAYNTTSGCSDTIQGTSVLEVLPSPIADFTMNNVLSPDRPLSGSLEFINNSLGASSYSWDFGNGDISIEETPTYYYLYSTEGTYYYSLEVANAAGCTDSMTQEIYLEFRKALFIPNALYPSSSNLEVARFIPKGTGMRTYKIEIFDLFGNVIWESSNLDDEGQPTGYWDGTFKGVNVEPDVYVWKVEAQFKDDSFWQGKEYKDEDVFRKTGTVTVIR